MTNSTATFNTLVAEALTQNFSGWDFSWLAGRWHEEDPPWDYTAIVRQAFPEASTLLDLDTGGGEILASLAPLPEKTVAIECYPPNIAVAQARLEPLGVPVVTPDDGETLPFDNESFDLAINRHGSFRAPEVAADHAAWRTLHHPAGRQPQLFADQPGAGS